MIAQQAILARRQIRLAVLAAVESAVTALSLNADIQSPGDVNTPPNKFPAIKVRTTGDQKQPVTRTVPEFTTTVNVEVEAVLEADTAEAAQDAIEQLGYQLETAILTDYTLVGLTQQIISMNTTQEVTSDGRRQLGGFKMVIGFECFEVFEPVFTQPLQSVGIHLDTAQPFDGSGTYANPAFPAAVTPAPRAAGPDGRDEGTLDITLPQ